MMRREDTRLLGCAGSGAVLATAWGGVALLLDWLGRQPPDVLARLRGAVLLLLGIGLVYVGLVGLARLGAPWRRPVGSEEAEVLHPRPLLHPSRSDVAIPSTAHPSAGGWASPDEPGRPGGDAA